MNKRNHLKKTKLFFGHPPWLRGKSALRFRSAFTLVMSCLLFAGCKNNTPVTELHGIQVPRGFTIEEVVDPALISYPMFASFDNEGRLFLCESTGETFSTEDHLKKPPYHIRLLEDRDGDGKFEKSTIFADSLTYPKGAVFFQGSLYVASAPDLLKLTDTDGDGVADKKEILLSGWVLHANAAAFGGPFMGPDGWLYLTDARRGFDITTREGETLKGKGARIWRCRPDGSGLESFSGGGFDNAVELVFMPGGEPIGTMTYFTDPMNGFRDALMHWVYGGVYPKPEQAIEADRLKLTGDLMPVMTKLPRIAHSGLMRYEGRAWGDSFKGNLFSAQFNTGRIMRHIIIPEGATYQTKDEPFITSSHADIHPTDVLEDADGSLLLVNTGGWFIAGCPLSVVAKKEAKAGIYRIRKLDAKRIGDPWGHRLNFTEMTAKDLLQYVTDDRPVVRSRAIEQLVIKGASAAEEIEHTLLSSENEEARTAAVFMLYRIDKTESTMDAMRSALDDKSAIVRTAAARVLGLSKDQSAVPKLMELVQADEAPVRREAATALGQIGNSEAISALIKASSNPNDRFVEHTVIYALITLRSPEPLIRALTDTAVNTRKAALIALDQMDDSPLRKDQLASFLNSENEALQNAGIWVAMHHLNWADVVVDFLKHPLNSQYLTASQEAAIRNLMIRFSTDAQMQQFITAQLHNKALDSPKRKLLLDVIRYADVEKLPGAWIQQLGHLLRSNDHETRSEVLNVIKSRRISSLNNELNRIIGDAKAPTDFRLKALGARLMSEPALTAAEFGMISSYIGSKNEAPVRQEAARLLTQATLSETQLVTLANEQVTTADVFLLPDLVNAYKSGKSEAAGKALITALETSKDRLDNLSVPDMQKLFAAYPSPVQAASGSLIQLLKEKQASRLEELEKLQSQLTRGDVAEGRQLFFGKATCFSCHAVEGKGGEFGPDLSNIGEIRSRHDILEAMLYPSASFAREYETAGITTKTGSYTGVIKEQLPDVIIIATGPGSIVRVPRNEIVSVEPGAVSLMPPGLLKQLNMQEISDLVAYLESLPTGMGQIKSH
ncbi:MAG: HEAT repeat domain-containing protein [Chitinophagaceae bacterium]|nr:HEAT repeat domain-containing protein [Chitinophagaceae bacterium]MCW5925301.1 HEAT repeat domain-containing protein [Chitinophagaceae bacterium]